MSSRARTFAAVTLSISCLIGPAAWAQAQNLDAGKSPSQLFAGACSACHKSPRGLLKTVASSALSGFLKEHYTTSGDMASQLATYVISNGAGDSRQAKQGADKQGQGGNEQPERGRKNRNAPSQEAGRPDDMPLPAEGGRQSRKRQAHSAEPSEEGKPVVDAPAQENPARGPNGRRLSAKQRNKPGKPPAAEAPSMANEPPNTEAPKAEPDTDEKAKIEPGQEMDKAAAKAQAETKPRDEKPRDEVKSEPDKSETARTEAPADSAAGDKSDVRRDPAPPMTAAPAAAVSAPPPAPTPAPAIATEPPSEPASSRATATTELQAVSASSPSPPRPAGPPAPPISQ